MGNRAAVLFKDKTSTSPAVYLHWNGGAESIYQFLDELKARYGAWHDAKYRAARFVQVVGDFLDEGGFSGLSLGLINSTDVNTLANVADDNGVFVVTPEGVTERYVPTYPNAGNGDYTCVAKALTQEEIDEERKSAYLHQYAEALPKQFQTIRDARATYQDK